MNFFFLLQAYLKNDPNTGVIILCLYKYILFEETDNVI